MRVVITCIALVIVLITACVLAGSVAIRSGMTFESFLAIILTALGVMLAILAIVIGVAAIWGYQGITERAAKLATEHAEKKLSELIRNQNVQDMLKALVQKEADNLFRDYALTSGVKVEPKQQDQDDAIVADSYPKEEPKNGERD